MALQCGIVGLPNVGKSTLFNALSNAKAQAANFPFCTKEPNVGIMNVPDARLTKLTEIANPHCGARRAEDGCHQSTTRPRHRKPPKHPGRGSPI